MDDDFSWDKSRMEFSPVTMTVSYEGGMRFTAVSPAGTCISLDAHRHLGGSGGAPNPIDYLIASLGGCVGIKILLSLSDHGIVPDNLTIGIHATRRQTLPAVFDHVHLVITLSAETDDEQISGILIRTMTLLCPVAAMFAEVGDVTFEHRIISGSTGT